MCQLNNETSLGLQITQMAFCKTHIVSSPGLSIMLTSSYHQDLPGTANIHHGDQVTENVAKPASFTPNPDMARNSNLWQYAM